MEAEYLSFAESDPGGQLGEEENIIPLAGLSWMGEVVLLDGDYRFSPTDWLDTYTPSK